MSKAAITFIVIFGTIVSGLLALIIIAVPFLAPMFKSNYAIPSVVENWGGVIIGFYFGSFFTMVSDLLKNKNAKTDKVE